MEIRLRPEIEDLIKQDVQRGSYKTVDEFVECAVSMLHEQEVWLAQNHAGIGARIEEGYAAAQRGELVDADAARLRLKKLKQTRSDEMQRNEQVSVHASSCSRSL
jgi:Arc/MetJ-type ribon-helix-helix transcriptional regulator